MACPASGYAVAISLLRVPTRSFEVKSFINLKRSTTGIYILFDFGLTQIVKFPGNQIV